MSRSLGPHLKKERELRGVSLAELAETTRISKTLLGHLENDEFEKLPGRAYVVGFLRAYAQAIGGDADDLLLRFHEQTGEVLTVAPPPPPPPAWWRVKLPWLLALAFLMVLATILIWP